MMRNFAEINTKKDFFISGYHFENAMSEPVDGADDIVIAESKEFVNFIVNSSHHEELRSNLQPMSKMQDGALLTSWLDIDKFYSFIDEGVGCKELYDNHDGYQSYGRTLTPIFEKMKRATENWKEIGVNEVYFSGYAHS